MLRFSKLGPLLVLSLVALGACRDETLGPGRSLTPVPGSGSAARLQCAVDVARSSLSCVPASSSLASLTIGGQGTYVYVRAASASYNSGASTFSANITVQNLTAQKMGTSDGSTVSGVKLFVSDGPTVTSGSGSISVANPDGTGTFTNSNQPYFLYNEILDQYGGTSAAKTWNFTVPSSVSTFTFTVLVNAAVPEETSMLRFTLENGPSARAYKMWGADARNVFAAGWTTIYRYNGTEWQAAATGLPGSYYAISGTSTKDVWAAGYGVGHYDGLAWSNSAVGTQQFLWGLWANTATDVWTAGDSGSVYHFNGSSWALSKSIGPALYGIRGTSTSDVWAVGAGGAIWHFDGSTWSTSSSGTTNDLEDVWAISASDVWAVGNSGVILHFNGSTWSSVTSPTTCIITSLFVTSASDIWATNGCGDALHYNGTSWSLVSTGLGDYLNAVVAFSATDVWVQGWFQTPSHFDGSTWRAFGAFTSPNNYAMWGTTSNIFVVTSNNTIWHRTAAGWAQMSSGLAQSLYAVTGTSGTNVWAVGPNGAAVNFNGTAWTSSSTGVSNTLNGVWAGSASNVIAVGSGGVILKYGGSTWASQTSPTTTTLLAVAGSSASDVWAVGFGGVIVHFNGTSWSSATSPTGQDLLTVCVNSATDAYAFGAAGTIIHFNGTSWATVTSPVSIRQLSASWCGSTSNVWAAGENGVAVHFDGTTWRKVASGTGENLWGVFATANDTFLAGDNGVIEHGTR